jgi:hypothetical protein
MEVSFDYDPSELKEFGRYIFLHTRNGLIILLIFPWLAFVLAGPWLGIFLRNLGLGYLIGVVLALLVALLWYRVCIWDIVRASNNPKRMQPRHHTVSIGPDGVKDSTAVNETTTNWILISKIIDYRGLILIKGGGNNFTFIPKRSFKNDQDSQHFVDLATSFFKATKNAPA